MTDQNQTDATTTNDDDDLRAMGLPAAFTLDELQGIFTDEEIDALSDGDDPVIEKAASAKPDDDDDLKEDEDGKAVDPEPEDETGKDAENPAPEEDPAPEPEPKDTTPQTPDPVYQPVDVSDHQKVLDTFKDDRKALRAKYGDGEMSDEEFDEAMDSLNDKVADAKAAIRDAERVDANNLETYKSAWFDRTGAVMNETPQFKDRAPVAALGGYSVAQVFDQACRHVTGDARYASMSLTEKAAAASNIAKAYYKQQTGEDLVSEQPKKTTPPEQKKPEEKPKIDPKEMVEKQGKRPDPVQTLGNLSAATDTEVDGGRFAAIDNSKGMDAEVAFERMSPEEQVAYLNGN